MSQEMESIPFISADGEEIDLYVLEQTVIQGVRYLLVQEEDGPEDDAYIMKEDPDSISQENVGDDEEISFVFVEDDDELEAVMKVFEQLMEDVDFVQDF